MRGSVAGALWGLVLGSTGLGVASLVGEQPGTDMLPGVAEVTQPQPAEAEPAPADLVEVPVDPVPALTAQAPRVAPPAAAPAETTPEADPLIAPLAVADEPVLPAVEPAAPPPETAAVEILPQAEVDAPAPPQLAEAEPEPVNTVDPVPAPVQEAVIAPPVVTEPALPETAQTPVAQEADAVPVLAEPQPVVAPEAEQPEQTIVVAPPAAPAPTAMSPQVPETTEPAAEVASVVAPAPVVAAAPITILPEEPTPVEADAPATIVEAPTPPSVPASEPVQPASPASAQADTVAPADAGPEAEVTALPRVNSGVRVNRPGAEPAPTAGTPSEVVTAEDLPEDAPALQRYAADFENVQDWPLVSIVLLDDGAMANAEAALAELTYPVTVILDPLQPDVETKMVAYRAAGIEVGLQVALPLGARAQDVEVAFEAAFGMVPEAVLLFSGGDDLLQSNRTITEQVIQVLAAEGLGLIAVERGLSSVLRIADQAEVPAAAVQRSLEEENVGAMGRALDQAALRARQGTGVILVGQLTPGMIDGLSNWAQDADVNQIAIAPASAVLLKP